MADREDGVENSAQIAELAAAAAVLAYGSHEGAEEHCPGEAPRYVETFDWGKIREAFSPFFCEEFRSCDSQSSDITGLLG